MFNRPLSDQVFVYSNGLIWYNYKNVVILGGIMGENSNLKEYLTQVRTLENDIYLMNSFETYCKRMNDDPRVERINKDLEDCMDLKAKKRFNLLSREYNYLFDHYGVKRDRIWMESNFMDVVLTKKLNKKEYPKLKTNDYFTALLLPVMIAALIIALFSTSIWYKITDFFPSSIRGELINSYLIVKLLLAAIIGYIIFYKRKKNMKSKYFKENVFEALADDAIASLNKELGDINADKAILLEQLNTTKKPLAIAKERLEGLYRKDIIFPKYRNFIAINQIAEYIDSGRCTELEGPNGAYNLFESELRQNIIIDKLETVINQLEQIKQNQFYIYQAMRDTRNAIDNMNISVVTNTYIDGVRY
jgi:hypothetical protein